MNLGKNVPASNFVATVAVNVDNQKLSDAEFRQFIRQTLEIVDYELPKEVVGRIQKQKGDFRAK